MEHYITAIATVVTILLGVWTIVNKKTEHMERRIDAQDDKIFLLATGKTLREAMIEAKRNKEEKV